MSGYAQDILKAADDVCIALNIPSTVDNCMPIAAALQAERDKGGWQPIETAPKDGTQVILFLARSHDNELDHIMVGGYVDDDFKVLTGIQMADMQYVTMLVMPWTHWTPLPSAPRKTGE